MALKDEKILAYQGGIVDQFILVSLKNLGQLRWFQFSCRIRPPPHRTQYWDGIGMRRAHHSIEMDG